MEYKIILAAIKFGLISAITMTGILSPAYADIYSHVEADGSLSLSNVPTDRHYAVLISEHGQSRIQRTISSDGKNKSPLQERQAQYQKMVSEAARRVGLESELLHAVIAVESSYDAKAISKNGATGLMQLMPETAKRYHVTDPFDPEQNINGGARYLRDLLLMFNSDMSLALAAYNSGENTVAKNGNRIPQIKETINYIPKVIGYYKKFQYEGNPY